ncbi:vWA domain-containing protein [Bryocella elongata]|nr:hypothetical protein [Bryocella elongata]
MQVAALVLNENAENIAGVTADKFNISIDSGPRFHPTRTRVEGDDPVSLAILLDDDGSDRDLMKAVTAELPVFARTALLPDDRISVYAVDCNLIGSANRAHATPEVMEKSIASALAYPTLHQPNGRHCGSKVKLWDTVTTVLARMSTSPERRVLLVVSSGGDAGSSISPEHLALRAGSLGVAVFSIASNTQTVFDPHVRSLLATGLRALPASAGMSYITSSNGGMIFSIDPSQVRSTLEHFARLLRTRYIVEFPTPDEGGAGDHNLSIEVPRAFEVLATGDSWNDLDQSVRDDPSTVHGSASPTVMGKKRPAAPR